MLLLMHGLAHHHVYLGWNCCTGHLESLHISRSPQGPRVREEAPVGVGPTVAFCAASDTKDLR